MQSFIFNFKYWVISSFLGKNAWDIRIVLYLLFASSTNQPSLINKSSEIPFIK